MNEKIIIGIRDVRILEAGEEINSVTRQTLTYDDLIELAGFLKSIPEPIKTAREEMESLAEAMTALSFGKQKVVINEIPKVNPYERQYKNKRKW